MDAHAEKLEEMNRNQINMWKITYQCMDDFEKADYKVQNHYKQFVKEHYHGRKKDTEVETKQKKD